MEARDVILKPVLTEKAYAGFENKKYVFIVAKKSNKIEIKQAVEEIFGVKVESVNTVNCRGKLKRMGKNEGYTPAYKKAFIQLAKDSKDIEFFKSLS